jgi:hypothetical protein
MKELLCVALATMVICVPVASLAAQAVRSRCGGNDTAGRDERDHTSANERGFKP